MILIALGLAGLIFGAGSSEVRRFERDAAEEIAAKLQGDQKRVQVKTKFDPLKAVSGDIKSATIFASRFGTEGLPLFTEPERSQRGKLGELKMVLTDFNLAGLEVERLEARIPDCRFDLGLAQRQRTFRLSKSGEGVGTVRVKADALAAFATRKFREIKRLKIWLDNDRVRVEGYGEFIVFNTDFNVEARLVAIDGTKLALADAKIMLGDKEADATSRDVLIQTLNPVVDLNEDLRLHGAIYVNEISLKDGYLIASGRTKIPTRTETARQLQTLQRIASPFVTLLRN